MTSLTRTDRLIAQLRTQLQRKNKRGDRDDVSTLGQSTGTVSSTSHPVTLIKSLHAAGVTDERMLVSSLIEGLLKQELGEAIGNASQFQQTVGLVVETLAENPETWSLCRECLAEAVRSAS